MSQKDFSKVDEVVRKTLNGIEIPMTGVEDLWNNIEAQKRKKRVFPFWILGLFALVALSVFGIFISEKQSSSQLKGNASLGSEIQQSVKESSEVVDDFKLDNTLIDNKEISIIRTNAPRVFDNTLFLWTPITVLEFAS